MEDHRCMLRQVPYRNREQVERDVEMLKRMSSFLDFSVSLESYMEKDEPMNDSLKLLCLRGKFACSTMENKTLAIPLDILFPLLYPAEPPIVRLRCPDSLIDGTHQLIYVSRCHKRVFVPNWTPDNSTLCTLMNELYQRFTSLSMFVLVAQQMHQAIRDDRFDILQCLVEHARPHIKHYLEQIELNRKRWNIENYDNDFDRHHYGQLRKNIMLYLVDVVEFDKNPLQVAVECGRMDMVRFLLQSEYDLKYKCIELSEQVMSGFNLPCWRGNSMLMYDVLSIGVYDGHLGSHHLHAAVIIAVQSGQRQTLRALVECGACITGYEQWWSEIPLIEACVAERVPIVEELLELGVDVNAKDRNSQYAVCTAAVSCPNSKVLRLLMKAGADIWSSDDRDSLSLLHKAAVRSRAAEVLSVLLPALSDDQVDRICDGRTPLVYALHSLSEEEAMKVIPLFLDAGADVNMRSGTWGLTALHLCIRRSFVRATRVLIAAGASLLHTDKHGNNLVMYALQSYAKAAERKPPIVEMIDALLKSREVQTALLMVNNHGDTALRILCKTIEHTDPVYVALLRRFLVALASETKDNRDRSAPRQVKGLKQVVAHLRTTKQEQK